MLRTALATGFAALFLGCANFAEAAPGSEPACGFGPPPGAPGFAEAQARREADMRQLGYERVCESMLSRYDIAFKDARRVMDSLAFPPVDLAATPFARFQSVGALSESMNHIASRLYRGFRMPGGQVLVLFEHDMSADDTSMSRDPKFEPERINGLPARLVVLQAPSGKAVSSLTWREGRRFYELTINANVARGPLRSELFALAASLPKSRPACPNRPERKPPKLGPDGFPELDMPPMMTVEEMNKRIEQQKRPCG
jgi:hypothetical protein